MNGGPTHSELVAAAVKWLTGTCGCAFAIGETVSWAGEIPDAVGFKSNMSILVECKTSRSDFFADRNKPFRTRPESGMGDHRYFLSPPDIIRPDDDLAGWGLLYLKNGKIKRVVCPVTKKIEDGFRHGKVVTWTNWNKRPHQKNVDKELTFVISIARRLAEGCPHLQRKISVRGRPPPTERKTP